MKIGLLVTARMGSTRLHDKHLKSLHGRPALSYLLDRIEHTFKTPVLEGLAQVFIATGNVLRFSEIFDFARFASESLFLFDSNITMLVSVPAGLFVGTDSNVYFLKGNDALDFGINLAYRAGAIFGSSVKVSAAEIAMQSTTDVVVFGISGEGICLGDGSGNVLNMTNIPVVFPVGKTGACCVTSEKQYIISLGG